MPPAWSAESGGAKEQAQQPKKKWWDFGFFRSSPLIETKLTTEVPIDIAIEKLRGFILYNQLPDGVIMLIGGPPKPVTATVSRGTMTNAVRSDWRRAKATTWSANWPVVGNGT